MRVGTLRRRPIHSKSFGNLSISRSCSARVETDEPRGWRPSWQAAFGEVLRSIMPLTTCAVHGTTMRLFDPFARSASAYKIGWGDKLSCDICALRHKHVVDCLQQKGRWSARLEGVRASQSEAKRHNITRCGEAPRCIKTPKRTKTQGKGAAWFSVN